MDIKVLTTNADVICYFESQEVKRSDRVALYNHRLAMWNVCRVQDLTPSDLDTCGKNTGTACVWVAEGVEILNRIGEVITGMSQIFLL